MASSLSKLVDNLQKEFTKLNAMITVFFNAKVST